MERRASSALATQSARSIWERHVEPNLDTYLALMFERMVREAYYGLPLSLDLPLIREWDRWEGLDRNPNPIEIDVARYLIDERVLSSSIKWHRGAVDVDVHQRHLSMLDRLAESAAAWAHEARQPASPLLYVAANGFTDRFRQAAGASRDAVHLWTLDDLYRPAPDTWGQL